MLNQALAAPADLKFSVAIVTYNRTVQLQRALESVYAQQRTDVEIVVVDNASTDGTAELVRERFPGIVYLRLPRNVGCPDGRNHVYANCRGRYIVNLDDDGWLAEGTLGALERVLDADPSIGIVAMRQAYPEQGTQGAGHAMSLAVEDVGVFSGGVSTFRRAMLEQTGAYPADFFLYAEESFLAIRVMDAGYRIVSAPHIVMWHPREGGNAGADWRDYHRFRNNLLVVVRLFPGRLLWSYFALRAGSYFVAALRRGTIRHYFAAMFSVLSGLPAALLARRPASKDAVCRHLRGRATVTVSVSEAQKLSTPPA